MKVIYQILILSFLIFKNIYGNVVSESSPKVALKGIKFTVIFNGKFSDDDVYKLETDAKSLFPSEKNEDKLIFNNIALNQIGQSTLILEKNKLEIYKLKKLAIYPWVSTLPPIIAIISGNPNIPARIKDSGVPPTPTHIGRGFWIGLG